MNMRLRLAIYGVATLLLLAFYAPARALTAILANLRRRLLSFWNFNGSRPQDLRRKHCFQEQLKAD